MSTSKHPAMAETSRQWRARWQLLAVAAVFGLPLLLAAVLHDLGLSSGRQNNAGELLHPPRAFSTAGLRAADGGDLAAEAFKGRWNLLHWQPQGCDADCVQSLHLSRQVRLALGKDARQVQRWLILAVAAAAPDTALLAQHGDLKWLRAGPEFAAAQLCWPGEEEPAPGYIRVVDPQGWLMLREPVAAGPKGFFRDLERVIKTSWIQSK